MTYDFNISSQVKLFVNFAAFPATGEVKTIYIDQATSRQYYWNGSAYILLTTNLTGYVPYTGATTDVDLGEYQLKAGQIELDQTPTGTFGVAKMRWNDTEGTAEIRLKGNNVTLQIGQEQLKRVVNKTDPLITLEESDYQAVVVAGAQGQRLAVKLAKADSDANSAGTIGIVTETIAANQEGFITTSGEVREINTTGALQGETWLDGDILYLSPTVFGGLTNVKPVAPDHLVVIGYVEYAHAVHGKIFVKVDNGYELDELHNVLIDTPTNGQALVFDEATELWKNTSPTIEINDVVISAGDWAPDAGIYKFTYSNAAITDIKVVEIIPHNDAYSVVQGIEVLPLTESFNGYVEFYCNNLPTEDFTVDILVRI